MNRLALLCGIGWLGACAAPTEDRGPGAAPASTATQDVFAYSPMGFARITAAGGVAVSFNSSAGATTVSHTTGSYGVTFAGLGAAGFADATGGDVQLTAEGTGNVKCHTTSWGGSPNLLVNVQCTQPNGTPADSAFAVQFFRYAMPSPNAFPTRAAYAWVQSTGAVSAFYDFNSSGTHNTVTRSSAGLYTVHIPGATAVNASMMVTPYGGPAGGAACSIAFWSGGTADVQCRNLNNVLVDSAFSFSYSTSGPSSEQQGAHAWFNGTAADPTYSAALGKIEGCSPASVTASRSGSLVTVVVSGDLGSWDGGAFLRASLSSAYGNPGYCKVESLTASGTAPSSTATTTLRCYDATGAVIAAPTLTFTHVTSDAAGPC